MLVGGCVRNYLNNEQIGDIDLATTLTPGEVIKKLANTNFKVLKTGIDHGTLTLQQDKEIFEITTEEEDVLQMVGMQKFHLQIAGKKIQIEEILQLMQFIWIKMEKYLIHIMVGGSKR